MLQLVDCLNWYQGKFSACVEHLVFTHDFLYCHLELNHSKIAKVVAYSNHMRLTCMADTCFSFSKYVHKLNWFNYLKWFVKWFCLENKLSLNQIIRPFEKKMFFFTLDNIFSLQIQLVLSSGNCSLWIFEFFRCSFHTDWFRIFRRSLWFCLLPEIDTYIE